MKKSLFLSLLVILCCFCVFANGNNETTQAEKSYTIQVGTTNQYNHPVAYGLNKFADLVKEYSNGTIEVKVYTDGTLGDERDLVEGCQLGTTKLAFSTTGAASALCPKLDVFNLPYLFDDDDHVKKVLNGEVGQEIAAEFIPNGLRLLSYFDTGWRQLTTTNKFVNTPADLKGLKIRVMESPVMIDTLNAMGASAVPMGWSEVITSLQQGVIDGQENPIINNVTNGAYEVQNYLALTRHFYGASVLIVNETFYQGLSENQKDALMRAAKEAADYEREVSKEMENAEFVKLPEKFGLTINENPDLDAFRKAVAPVYDKYADKFGGWDIINKIKATK